MHLQEGAGCLYPMLMGVIKGTNNFSQILLSLHDTSPHSAFRGTEQKMDGGANACEEHNRYDGENDVERRIK